MEWGEEERRTRKKHNSNTRCTPHVSVCSFLHFIPLPRPARCGSSVFDPSHFSFFGGLARTAKPTIIRTLRKVLNKLQLQNCRRERREAWKKCRSGTEKQLLRLKSRGSGKRMHSAPAMSWRVGAASFSTPRVDRKCKQLYTFVGQSEVYSEALESYDFIKSSRKVWSAFAALEK